MGPVRLGAMVLEKPQTTTTQKEGSVEEWREVVNLDSCHNLPCKASSVEGLRRREREGKKGRE